MMEREDIETRRIASSVRGGEFHDGVKQKIPRRREGEVEKGGSLHISKRVNGGGCKTRKPLISLI